MTKITETRGERERQKEFKKTLEKIGKRIEEETGEKITVAVENQGTGNSVGKVKIKTTKKIFGIILIPWKKSILKARFNRIWGIECSIYEPSIHEMVKKELSGCAERAEIEKIHISKEYGLDEPGALSFSEKNEAGELALGTQEGSISLIIKEEAK